MGSTGRGPELVIFDCDGVLVDSEPLSIGILVETLNELGFPVSVADCYRQFLGRSLSSMNSTLRETYGRALSDAELGAMRECLYQVYRRELKPIAGVAHALEGLGLPFCVASSSQPDRIRLSLQLTGLLSYFGTNIFSSSMVEHGKPAPDLFLYAARQMGAAPQDCIVVEDSPAGIVAAGRAAMRAFAFVGGSHAGPAGLREIVAPLRPNCIFERMDDLPDLIAGLSQG